ncbi:MAG: dTMP kinase [Erysipelotrichaceae bacterium]|jgi:dTMP kinase|nr:dTMP kinase [Erysipelotrichaceae bacterium]
MRKGVFITFEGNDGAGKTTVCLQVLKRLKQEGHEVIYTREPGGSRIAETIRNILLDVDNKELTARTEALLYAASRSQHLQEIVIPALQAGKIVLCDRYVDSSLAYQGVARDLGIEDVWKINEFAIDGYMPQKTLFFAVSIETGQKRMNIRGDKNRLDLEQDSFHQKVRRGYEALIKMYPERIQVIDAEPALDVVVQAAYDVVKKVIEEYE